MEQEEKFKEYPHWPHHINKLINRAHITVNFPFQPYDIQETFIDMALESIRLGCTAAIESPTGTGKTACILASIMASETYYKNLKDIPSHIPFSQNLNRNALPGDKRAYGDSRGSYKVPNPTFKTEEVGAKLSLLDKPPQKYIYLARTHSQISQFLKEAARWLPFRGVHLASREQLCKHSYGPSGASNEKCIFSNQAGNTKLVEYAFRKSIGMADIDALLSSQKALMKTTCCPHGAAHEAVARDDVRLIAMPYDYLANDLSKKKFAEFISNSTVFIDEGHNSIKSYAESSSFSFDLDYLGSLLDLVNFTSSVYETIVAYSDENTPPDALAEQRASAIEVLSDRLSERELNYDKTTIANFITTMLHSLSELFPGRSTHEVILSEWSNNVALFSEFVDLLSSFFGHFLDIDSKIENFDTVAFGKTLSGFCHEKPMMMKSLRSIETMLSIASLITADVFALSHNMVLPSLIKLCKTYTQYDSTDYALFFSENGGHTFFNGICIRPRNIFSELLSTTRNIIFTSGTLSPFESFKFNIGFEPPLLVSLPHVIPQGSLKVLQIGRDQAGSAISWTFKERDKSTNPDALLVLLQNLIAGFKNGGVLTGFPSSAAMDSVVKTIESLRSPVKPFLMVEPRSASDVPEFLENFKKKAAVQVVILFFVMRGKLSEGVDFKNHLCRAVIVAGIPFSPITNPTVIETKRYLDKNSHLNYSSQSWYVDDAFMSINQTCGRAIRHVNDWGMIILFDTRFETLSTKLSEWLHPFIKKSSISLLPGEIKELIEANQSNKSQVSASTTTQTSDTAPSIKNIIIQLAKHCGKENAARLVDSLKFLKANNEVSAKENLEALINFILQTEAVRGTPEYIFRKKLATSLKQVYPPTFWPIIEHL